MAKLNLKESVIYPEMSSGSFIVQSCTLQDIVTMGLHRSIPCIKQPSMFVIQKIILLLHFFVFVKTLIIECDEVYLVA